MEANLNKVSELIDNLTKSNYYVNNNLREEYKWNQ